MDQSILDRAVKIATQRALASNPVAGIVWIPPSVPTDDPIGGFVVIDCPPLGAGDTAPWEY